MAPCSGFCKDLLDISKREYICSKPHLVISEEDHEDAGIARTPSPTNQIPEEPRPVTPPVTSSALDMEIEHGRFGSIAASPPLTIPAPNVGIELNLEGDCRSPVGRDDLTPGSAQNLRSVSVSLERTNVAMGTMQTPDLATPPTAHGSMMETTPMTHMDDTFQHFVLSDTHQLINSAATEVSF